MNGDQTDQEIAITSVQRDWTKSIVEIAHFLATFRPAIDAFYFHRWSFTYWSIIVVVEATLGAILSIKDGRQTVRLLQRNVGRDKATKILKWIAIWWKIIWIAEIIIKHEGEGTFNLKRGQDRGKGRGNRSNFHN